MPRLLVTGAAGRIGRRLRARLEADGTDASYLVGRPSPIGSRSSVDVADVTDPDRLDEVVAARRPEAIIHLASLTGAQCDADPLRAAAVNVGAVRSLAESAARHGVTRVVLASTSAVYGDGYCAPVDESGALVLESLYARTKRDAELELAAAAASSPTLSTVVLRIFNVFGPGMADSLANRLLVAPAETPVVLAGLDGFTRDYIHVDDVVDALIRASHRSTGQASAVVNVGTGRPTSNRELVSALEPVCFTVGAPRASYSCADIATARTMLGFEPIRVLSRDSVLG
ncbi:MAG: NAD(P)-dependent oxidoreductase [Pseudolysinimonas sp.]